MSEISNFGQSSYPRSRRELEIAADELAFPRTELVEMDVRPLPSDEITAVPDHFRTFLAGIEEDGYLGGWRQLTDNPNADKTIGQAAMREMSYHLALREDQPAELPDWVKRYWINEYGQPKMIEPKGEI